MTVPLKQPGALQRGSHVVIYVIFLLDYPDSLVISQVAMFDYIPEGLFVRCVLAILRLGVYM